ncbi:MAG TPA: 5-(carboxyamino)imidazole ribonucleotide mutase [Tissierellia bacterium]|nr:5-(carboxyamino)imidazole ribonucleotide mutase [Tissierellia bacterium]
MTVAIMMGSGSDYDKIKPAIELLKSLAVPVETRVLSAHRSPEETVAYTKQLRERGIRVVIAAAGKAAHLPGVVAGLTDLPVIGLPIGTSVMGGMDSLLSMVQMPSGVPVMTVAIDGAVNAALSAVRILSLSDDELAQKHRAYIASQRDDVLRQDEAIQQKEQDGTR